MPESRDRTQPPLPDCHRQLTTSKANKRTQRAVPGESTAPYAPPQTAPVSAWPGVVRGNGRGNMSRHARPAWDARRTSLQCGVRSVVPSCFEKLELRGLFPQPPPPKCALLLVACSPQSMPREKGRSRPKGRRAHCSHTTPSCRWCSTRCPIEQKSAALCRGSGGIRDSPLASCTEGRRAPF
jgi:hypothetical protein